MASFFKPVGLVTVLSVIAAVGASSVSRNVHAKDRCRKIHGTTNSLFVTQNCASPVGLCTAGTVSGGGPLDGAFVFLALDAAPSAGMPSVEPAGNLSFSGQLTVSAKKGTLVARDLGVLDAVNGFFTEVDRPTSGTGAFANPSHDFFISGTVNSAGNGFIGEISGTICSDRDADDDSDE
jgi:hypothetical protein